MAVPSPSNLLLGQPIPVIGPQFCAPYPVDLTVTEKAVSITDGDYAVTDVNGNIVFKMKGVFFSLRDKRTLLDASGNPIVTMQQKILSAHRRWQGYRGDSTDSKDLLFSAKKASLIQFKTEVDVFLASNTSNEHIPDFKIKGSFFERSCTIYQGKSDGIVAQEWLLVASTKGSRCLVRRITTNLTRGYRGWNHFSSKPIQVACGFEWHAWIHMNIQWILNWLMDH